jgi:hypothetical protein
MYIPAAIGRAMAEAKFRDERRDLCSGQSAPVGPTISVSPHRVPGGTSEETVAIDPAPRHLTVTRRAPLSRRSGEPAGRSHTTLRSRSARAPR